MAAPIEARSMIAGAVALLVYAGRTAIPIDSAAS
jgi:hypothetical protein